MGNAHVAFGNMYGYTPDDVRRNKPLAKYQEIVGHMVFDINMDGKFTRKSHCFAGGHMT